MWLTNTNEGRNNTTKNDITTNGRRRPTSHPPHQRCLLFNPSVSASEYAWKY